MRKVHTFLQTTLTLVVLVHPSLNKAQTNAAPTNAPVSRPSYYQPVQLDREAYNPAYGVSLFWPGNGEDGTRAWSQTKSMLFYAVGAMGVLAVLPRESTGWEDSSDDPFKKWQKNVKAGPEWDRNKWGYNYIGHMYVGGVYYQIARKSGYRQWDSFLYTALMSTLLWEYGIEAFAEVPSIQDLIFTPIAGWLYGEWAYRTEFSIRGNENKVLGSRTLGGVSLFLLDPVDGCGRAVNWITRHNLVKSGYGYFSYSPVAVDGVTDHQVYYHVIIPIGPAGPEEKPDYSTYHFHDQDPVDFGIIGFGAGIGHTALDNHWGVTDDLFTKLNLGLYFTPRISMRLAYAWGDVENRATRKIVEYENYSWDTQVYFLTEQKLRPYISAGFGRQVWEEDRETRSFQWNGGLGVHYQFHHKLSLNVDWLNYYSPSQETHDRQFNIGMVYRFGDGEHSNW